MDEHLAQRAKKEALARNISLSEFVSRAIQQALRGTPKSTTYKYMYLYTLTDTTGSFDKIEGGQSG